ncbi:transcriptional regulator [Microbacterium lacticum]|uniref:LysR family substrate-binding domain-containing protein n=1 Tax=Microbacterium lacticum TaxID=33885 RepID=UPI0018B0E635|nr:LysR family substrate-binding domain-containing protein [Microbacterium lacticum]MBF9337544.1 transcriptional regulator [Microbacterium lacticum]
MAASGARSGRSGTSPRRGSGGAKPRPAAGKASSGKASSGKASSGKGSGARASGDRGATRKNSPGSAPAPRTPAPTGPFRLGAIEGATPGKWIDVWKERMPGIRLELVPLEISDQRRAVTEASVDAALVRLPIDRTGLQAITLYEETPVVVCAADAHLTAAGELTVADLAGEVVIVPQNPPVTVVVDGAVPPSFDAPATVAEAIAIAATGVGVVIVPMSLARLHHRKDAAYRPLVDGPLSPVALVWPDGETPPLVDTFIGIVRGRTANSSR